MSRAILATTSLVVMSVFCVIAFINGISGPTVVDLIDRLPIIFSPIRATYALLFIILFYLMMYCVRAFKISISLIQALLFFINSLLQIVAIYYWCTSTPMYTLLAELMLIVGLFVYYITFPIDKRSIQYRTPIALWLSWNVFFILIVFNFNMIAYDWSGFGLSDSLWGVILLTLGTIFAIHVRYYYKDKVSSIVFIIGFIGIIFENGFNELFVSTAALFLIGVLLVGIKFFQKNYF